MNKSLFFSVVPWLLVLVCFAVGFDLNASDSAGIVINEIFYHAPDDLDDLEFVELHNTSGEEVNLSGWRLSKGVKFTFPKGTTLGSGAYAVVCKDADLLKEFYNVAAIGEYKKSLSNSGDELRLTDSDGKVVESMTYADGPPWPKSADGYSASLERVCPTSPAGNPSNWLPSELSGNYDKLPAGTPGRANSVFAKAVPPTVDSVTWQPAQPKPGTALTVTVRPKLPDAIDNVSLIYRYVAPGNVGDERTAAMTRDDGEFTAKIPVGNEANRLLRFRIVATSTDFGVATVPASNDLRPSYTVYVNDAVQADHLPVLQFFHVGKKQFEAGEVYQKLQEQDFSRGRRGFGGFGGRGGFERRGGFGRGFRGGSTPKVPLLPQGPSAIVYTDPATAQSQVFDFVNIVERKSGWKVRFHKDRPLLGMTTMNVLYEPDEATILNESLAYELYRLAGNASYLSGYMRVIVNGKPAGYHLYFEQPNGNFFRRNKIDDKGDLYKLIWMGNAEISERIPNDKRPTRPDIAGRHEKKTNPHNGYQDLIEVIEKLEKADSDQALRKVVQDNFDLENVINYFAVNSLLSHWDGFFNNYFLYFDRKGTGKWSMFPWDQDSTWSQRGGTPEELYEMPLYFGAEGATPDGIDRSKRYERRNDDRRSRNPFGGRGFGRGGFGGRGFGQPGFGRGMSWWRPGGDFARPLLAHPEFYKRYTTRLQDLIDNVFNEDVFYPKIDKLRTTLEPEVRLRARMRSRDEKAAVDELDRTALALLEHLVRRRAFLQREIKKEFDSLNADD